MSTRIRVTGTITVCLGYRDYQLTLDEARELRDALMAILEHGEETRMEDEDEDGEIIPDTVLKAFKGDLRNAVRPMDEAKQDEAEKVE